MGIYTQKHTQTDIWIEMNQLTSDRHQVWQKKMEGERRRERHEGIYSSSQCAGSRSEKKTQPRHLHTPTLPRKLRWPVANQSWHSGWIMHHDVCREWDREGWYNSQGDTKRPRGKEESWKTHAVNYDEEKKTIRSIWDFVHSQELESGHLLLLEREAKHLRGTQQVQFPSIRTA